MYEKPRIINVKGRTISIAHLELPTQPQTLLTADISASATALAVLDNAGFVNAQPILIGVLGTEQTEIKKVNAAVSAGTSLTSTSTTFAHSAGTSVQRVLFNQWKIYGNSTNSSSGATLIATVDMQVDAPSTTYVNASTEYDYYLVLPFDSFNTVTGDSYSDGVSNSTSYATNTVGYLINKALHDSKTKRTGDINDEWLFAEINDCLRFITGKLKRWSFLQNFDYVLGQSSRGLMKFTLPSDIEDPNSPKSILSVRIGGEAGLIYKDKREWEEELEGVSQTDVRTQATSGQTTLEIDNSYDFNDSGSVKVFISGTEYTITYTGVTRSATAGILTGIPASGTGSISVTIPVDTKVWQGEIQGLPRWFTVYDGSLYIWPLADSSYDNMNVYLDYHTSRTAVDSAGDVVEGQRYDAVLNWLIWKLRGQNNASGKQDLDDGNYVIFKEILGDLVRREVSGQKFKMKPRVNFIDYGGGRRGPQVLPVE